MKNTLFVLGTSLVMTIAAVLAIEVLKPPQGVFGVSHVVSSPSRQRHLIILEEQFSRDTSIVQDFVGLQIVQRSPNTGGVYVVAEISAAQFSTTSGNRTWVSSLHSVDDESGMAVIKVAEGNAPETAASIQYLYTWRKWDIVNNLDMGVLEVCANPFADYTGVSLDALSLD